LSGGNVFPYGDMEALDPVGVLLGWEWTRFGNVSLVQEAAGNHYLRITHEQKDPTLQACACFTLNPRWKALEVSCRMKVFGLKMGNALFLTASVVLRWKDKDDKLLSYAPSLTLTHDTDWTTLHEILVVPPSAAHLDIEAANIGDAGEMGFDDVVFRPTPAP
jgi:hypothetical protein